MNPKICDFGISSEKETGRKILDTGGTPAFLAPEVILCKGEIDYKTDVWSLGVLLYLLAYGTVPFEAKSVQQLYQKILDGFFIFPKEDIFD